MSKGSIQAVQVTVVLEEVLEEVPAAGQEVEQEAEQVEAPGAGLAPTAVQSKTVVWPRVHRS